MRCESVLEMRRAGEAALRRHLREESVQRRVPGRDDGGEDWRRGLLMQGVHSVLAWGGTRDGERSDEHTVLYRAVRAVQWRKVQAQRWDLVDDVHLMPKRNRWLFCLRKLLRDV